MLLWNRDGHIDKIERSPVFSERRNVFENHGLHVIPPLVNLWVRIEKVGSVHWEIRISLLLIPDQ